MDADASSRLDGGWHKTPLLLAAANSVGLALTVGASQPYIDAAIDDLIGRWRVTP